MKPVILTSIKPLTMIAAAVLGDEVEVRQLLPDQEIPHHYALRVSDRRLFDQGQLVLWIGPELETFMGALVAEREPRSVIRAAELSGIVWPETTERGRDYHLWLNPDNALLIARTLVLQVSELSGVNKAVLKARLQNFEGEIATLKQVVGERLLTLKDNKFIVDHDAFRHFTETFGLHSAGYLRDSSGLEIGARARAKIMSQEGVRCVIAEPESRIDRLQGLATKWHANLAIIDPLGAKATGFEGQPEVEFSAYAGLINTITEGFVDCLELR
ncbi:MAG: metal ABC transporter substrate-binding protein [Porticoccaceae bacterium]